MQRSQVPPRRNIPSANSTPSPTITVTITGDGQGMGKTQLAEYMHHALRNWFPKGIERPQVIIVDRENRKPVNFNVGEVLQEKYLLSKIKEAGQVANISQSIQMRVAADRLNEDPEREGFALEMAMQYGFMPIDDDAEIYGVTAERLVDLMSVLGYRTRAERQAFHTGGFVGGPMTSLNEIPAMAVPPKLTFDALTGKPGHADVTVVAGYTGLLGVLVEALNQAQYGKGADRHNMGGDIPFERQRMQQISELIGSPDGMVYQACKKITEGVKLPTLDRQVAELLGAVNYICGIVIFLRKGADSNIDPNEAAENHLRKLGIPT